jgi:hypothetical protein
MTVYNKNHLPPYEEPTTPKKYQIKILASVGFLGYNKKLYCK